MRARGPARGPVGPIRGPVGPVRGPVGPVGPGDGVGPVAAAKAVRLERPVGREAEKEVCACGTVQCRCKQNEHKQPWGIMNGGVFQHLYLD